MQGCKTEGLGLFSALLGCRIGGLRCGGAKGVLSDANRRTLSRRTLSGRAGCACRMTTPDKVQDCQDRCRLVVDQDRKQMRPRGREVDGGGCRRRSWKTQHVHMKCAEPKHLWKFLSSAAAKIFGSGAIFLLKQKHTVSQLPKSRHPRHPAQHHSHLAVSIRPRHERDSDERCHVIIQSAIIR